ncbi:RNA polymerase sigma-70 factor (ECF subfamily) [Leucobacter luti]|nr:RNA polymerase sigma-70 factor (ECF subfamily) [Leucobacter luti]
MREHWAPLLRSLILFSHRVDLAEDALAAACERALQAWSAQVPAHPVAWVRRTAQRALIDELRHEQAFTRRHHLIATDESVDARDAAPSVMDDRIELLWLACHPALGSESRSLLALRFVFGLSTERIARIFLVSTSTMAARITRAKKRVAADGFVLASSLEYPERAADVARAISAAYAASYFAGDDTSDDIIALLRQIVQLRPHPTLDALDVLVSLTHARRDARIDADGRLLTLAEQDRSKWRANEISAALRRYVTLQQSTGYAEELRAYATIEAAHALAPCIEQTDWSLIDAAHDRLTQLGHSPLDLLERTAGRAVSGRPLDPVDVERLSQELPDHHRVFVVAAHLRRQEGDEAGADTLIRQAIELCGSEHERRALLQLLNRTSHLAPSHPQTRSH